MPPKKNCESKPIATKKAQEKKTAKAKVKKLKTPPKTPTIIKLKISAGCLNNSKNMSPKDSRTKNETTPKLTKKQLALAKKFQLTNEVAAAQLAYKNNTIIEVESNETAPPKSNRGRKKKITPEHSEPSKKQPIVPELNAGMSAATDSEDAFDVEPKKRKYLRKNVLKLVENNYEITETKGQKPLSLTLKKKTIKQTKLTNANSGITKLPKTKKPEMSTESKTKKIIAKADSGKINERASIGSPSILDQVEVHVPKQENSLTTNETESANIDKTVEPGSIDSRKTSSASECLSWTKDISSSSTTTCVTVRSTDFVRIDKKMPIIKLTPALCYPNPAKVESSSSSSDTTDTESSPTYSPLRELTPEIETRSLDLSMSSISPTKSRASSNCCQNSVKDEETNKITHALDKLSSKLKHFDLEIINWIGYEKEEIDIDSRKFQDNIFRMLKEESEVITQCRRLKRILSDSVFDEDGNENCNESSNKNDDTKVFIENCSDSNQNNSNSVVAVVNTSEEAIKDVERFEDDENNFTSDRVSYVPFDQSCDDDDALSLFAESITGIESSRRNSSAASMCTTADFEEYTPQPLNNEKWEPAKRISYPPPCFVEKQNDVRKPICEKQNADSTSIYKEADQNRGNTVSLEKNVPPNMLGINAITPNTKRPCLMSDIFKPVTGMKSMVFRGICFYNILASCKNTSCRFPHKIPTYEEITAKLMERSEEMFIQEYMLIRNWPVLRRKYGMCFVQECIRRDLTRILVEMGLDFVIKANEKNSQDDLILKVMANECVLLHLNNVDLQICEDLLVYKHQGDLLCEIFMQVIANTQNFSRFKPIFIKLTKFILAQGRSFSLDVATQFLERICILPSEPPLLEAMMAIVRCTDRAILNNSMLRHFENQLSVVSKELHGELLKLKMELSVGRPVLQGLYGSPRAPPEIEPVNAAPPVCEREKRYTSPDTTNLDTMNKPADEIIITRTVDCNKSQLFKVGQGTIKRSFSNSNSSNESTEEFRPKVVPKPDFKKWKDRSIFNSILPLSPMARHASPRPLIKRHIHQQMNFGPSPSKFPRRSGPDFF